MILAGVICNWTSFPRVKNGHFAISVFKNSEKWEWEEADHHFFMLALPLHARTLCELVRPTVACKKQPVLHSPPFSRFYAIKMEIDCLLSDFRRQNQIEAPNFDFCVVCSLFCRLFVCSLLWTFWWRNRQKETTVPIISATLGFSGFLKKNLNHL